MALQSVEELDRLADQFPARSPGQRAIRAAAWKLRISYVYGTKQKNRVILIEIGKGSRTISDLVTSTGMKRSIIKAGVSDLVAKGYLNQRNVRPVGGRAGRPLQSYTLADKGTEWFNRIIISNEK